MQTSQQENKGLSTLYTIGGVAAFLQLAAIVGYGVALGTLGPKPVSAQEYFAIHQRSTLEMILRGDLLMLILIALYLGTFPALYAALRRVNPVFSMFAALFTIMAVVGTFAAESTFSMLYLGDQYAAAASEAQRAQIIAAGEAVIASDMWNSTAAYMGGILLQGSGVIISVIMLRSQDFSKGTALSGLVGNGLDLIQHLLHPFLPSVSEVLQSAMGPFYLVWFIMLGLNLLRLAKRMRESQV